MQFVTCILQIKTLKTKNKIHFYLSIMKKEQNYVFY